MPALLHNHVSDAADAFFNDFVSSNPFQLGLATSHHQAVSRHVHGHDEKTVERHSEQLEGKREEEEFHSFNSTLLNAPLSPHPLESAASSFPPFPPPLATSASLSFSNSNSDSDVRQASGKLQRAPDRFREVDLVCELCGTNLRGVLPPLSICMLDLTKNALQWRALSMDEGYGTPDELHGLVLRMRDNPRCGRYRAGSSPLFDIRFRNHIDNGCEHSMNRIQWSTRTSFRTNDGLHNLQVAVEATAGHCDQFVHCHTYRIVEQGSEPHTINQIRRYAPTTKKARYGLLSQPVLFSCRHPITATLHFSTPELSLPPPLVPGQRSHVCNEHRVPLCAGLTWFRRPASVAAPQKVAADKLEEKVSNSSHMLHLACHRRFSVQQSVSHVVVCSLYDVCF